MHWADDAIRKFACRSHDAKDGLRNVIATDTPRIAVTSPCDLDLFPGTPSHDLFFTLSPWCELEQVRHGNKSVELHGNWQVLPRRLHQEDENGLRSSGGGRFRQSRPFRKSRPVPLFKLPAIGSHPGHLYLRPAGDPSPALLGLCPPPSDPRRPRRDGSRQMDPSRVRIRTSDPRFDDHQLKVEKI